MGLLSIIDFTITSKENQKHEVLNYGYLIGTRYEFGQNKILFTYNDFLVELTTSRRGILKVKSIEVVDADVLINYTQGVDLQKIFK